MIEQQPQVSTSSTLRHKKDRIEGRTVLRTIELEGVPMSKNYCKA